MVLQCQTLLHLQLLKQKIHEMSAVLLKVKLTRSRVSFLVDNFLYNAGSLLALRKKPALL